MSFASPAPPGTTSARHGRAQGASTLTMQLARNLFLSSERTAMRKIQEAYLAIQIERAFTKQQIFTLYGNQIYLGSGMYGFEAASEFFFSKHAKDLTLTEAALLAGLPKGPVAYSPLLNPERRCAGAIWSSARWSRTASSLTRRPKQARAAPLGLHIAQPGASVAPWFQEEVRRELEKHFGTEEVHEAGLRVDTTLDLDLQQTANRAVADGLAAYERRHGWTGKLENVLADGVTLDAYRHPDWAVTAGPGDYIHAVVTRVLPLEIHARIGPPGQPGSEIVLLPADWQWTGQRSRRRTRQARRHHLCSPRPRPLKAPRAAPRSSRTPAPQGALLAMDNTSGDVSPWSAAATTRSRFNRATQAERQTGSSFKPYVYTAAIEDGVKPTDIIVDAPVSFGGYAPHNYENDYKGAMTVANAFAESRNIPALKLAARVGIHKVIDMAHRFGVTSEHSRLSARRAGRGRNHARGAGRLLLRLPQRRHPRHAASHPQSFQRRRHHALAGHAGSQRGHRPANRAHHDDAAARRHRARHRRRRSSSKHPLGGKTGTTSDFTDAWFLGFSPSVTCGVWVGYDSRESLGEKETGARAALPIWIDFMRAAIAGKDDEQFLADQSDSSLDQATAAPEKPAVPAPAPIQSPRKSPSRLDRDPPDRRLYQEGCSHASASRRKYRFARATSLKICAFSASGDGHSISPRRRSRNSSSSGVFSSISTGSKFRMCDSTANDASPNVGRLPTFVTA